MPLPACLWCRDAILLQPSGAYAAKGSTCEIKIGQQEIILQHTSPRDIAAAGLKSGTAIQALGYIGKTRWMISFSRRCDVKSTLPTNR
jgi:hypothetical protein